MESIGDILGKRQDIRENFEKLVTEVLKNADVQAFIAQHQMTSDEIQRSYSKFYEYVREHEKFEKGEKRAAEGYEPVLIMNHGYADVSYQTTNELAQQQAAQNLLRRVNIIGLPKDLKQVTLADIALDDVQRIKPYQALVDFITNFPLLSCLYMLTLLYLEVEYPFQHIPLGMMSSSGLDLPISAFSIFSYYLIFAVFTYTGHWQRDL